MNYHPLRVLEFWGANARSPGRDEDRFGGMSCDVFLQGVERRGQSSGDSRGCELSKRMGHSSSG